MSRSARKAYSTALAESEGTQEFLAGRTELPPL